MKNDTVNCDITQSKHECRVRRYQCLYFGIVVNISVPLSYLSISHPISVVGLHVSKVRVHLLHGSRTLKSDEQSFVMSKTLS